jgi:hypothetical protein
MLLSRRKFLRGLGATLIAAPAIVRASSLDASIYGLKLYTTGPNPNGYAEILAIGDSETQRGMALSGLSTTTPGFNIAIDVSNPLCFERRWQFGGHTVLSRDPFDWTGGTITGSIGFIQTFMRAFAASNLLTPGQSVRATAAGVGGTTFAGNGTNGYWWDVTGNSPGTGTSNAVTYMNAAIAENPTKNYLAAILIAGCPNDIGAGTTQANFLAALVGIVGYIRANVTGASNAPAIGTSCPYNYIGASSTTPCILAWGQFAANVSNSAYIDPGFTTTNYLGGYPDPTDGGDGEHFTNVSMRTIGQQMLTQLQGL